MGLKTYTLVQWEAEARRRFGDDPAAWRFVCPRCGAAQSIQDFLDAGVAAQSIRDFVDAGFDRETIEKVIGFSCIGRYAEGRGCDWTLGGLFKIHQVEVVADDGKRHPYFDFAEEQMPAAAEAGG